MQPEVDFGLFTLKTAIFTLNLHTFAGLHSSVFICGIFCKIFSLHFLTLSIIVFTFLTLKKP